MEIIKLDRRHKMYHKGFRHALRFPQWNPHSRKIENKLNELYPRSWHADTTGEWMIHWPRYKQYWIGFKNEYTITLILLSVDLED